MFVFVGGNQPSQINKYVIMYDFGPVEGGVRTRCLFPSGNTGLIGIGELDSFGMVGASVGTQPTSRSRRSQYLISCVYGTRASESQSSWSVYVFGDEKR